MSAAHCQGSAAAAVTSIVSVVAVLLPWLTILYFWNLQMVPPPTTDSPRPGVSLTTTATATKAAFTPRQTAVLKTAFVLAVYQVPATLHVGASVNKAAALSLWALQALAFALLLFAADPWNTFTTRHHAVVTTLLQTFAHHVLSRSWFGLEVGVAALMAGLGVQEFDYLNGLGAGGRATFVFAMLLGQLVLCIRLKPFVDKARWLASVTLRLTVGFLGVQLVGEYSVGSQTIAAGLVWLVVLLAVAFHVYSIAYAWVVFKAARLPGHAGSYSPGKWGDSDAGGGMGTPASAVWAPGPSGGSPVAGSGGPMTLSSSPLARPLSPLARPLSPTAGLSPLAGLSRSTRLASVPEASDSGAGVGWRAGGDSDSDVIGRLNARLPVTGGHGAVVQ